MAGHRLFTVSQMSCTICQSSSVRISLRRAISVSWVQPRGSPCSSLRMLPALPMLSAMAITSWPVVFTPKMSKRWCIFAFCSLDIFLKMPCSR